jgi:excisionase family DNA binding protein
MRDQLFDTVISEMPPLAVSADEACRLLRIGRSKLYRHVKMGDVRPVHMGGRVLFIVDDLKEFLRTQQQRQTELSAPALAQRKAAATKAVSARKRSAA